jgi:hypothetical protein
MRILADFYADLELYSIDEAFLGLAGFETRLEAHAPLSRLRVPQWTDIPVSVGIAATKTLAKAANHRAKRDPACDGVCVSSTYAGCSRFMPTASSPSSVSHMASATGVSLSAISRRFGAISGWSLPSCPLPVPKRCLPI